MGRLKWARESRHLNDVCMLLSDSLPLQFWGCHSWIFSLDSCSKCLCFSGRNKRPWIFLLWEWNLLLVLCNTDFPDSLKRKPKKIPKPYIKNPPLQKRSWNLWPFFKLWILLYKCLLLLNAGAKMKHLVLALWVQHMLRESEEQYFGTGTPNPNTCTHAAWCFISGYKLDYNMPSPCGHCPGKPGWICLMHKMIWLNDHQVESKGCMQNLYF